MSNEIPGFIKAAAEKPHALMGVDIETYSSVDLSRAGVYAYTEAPDFDILLIGFKFADEDDVEVIDCTDLDSQEEALKLLRFQRALEDPRIIKTAYNANFERTCLAKWTGHPTPPEEWRDTMIKALTLGLPRGLADVGIAMGLPADKMKDPVGKALITYFCKPCKPTRVNGQRTRNMPAHDPEKWALFKSYNRQDVVTEQEIAKRLNIYKTTDAEQALWSLDQHMNDNGVRLDVPMVRRIVSYDEQRRAELQQEATELTGLSNPNSLQQLKGWLQDQGMPLTSVTKDTIAAALQLQYIPDNVRRMLEIRQALGKTSVAKYSTMLEAVCKDGRLRGILQFYGANRSGRWAGKLVQTHNLARNTLEDLDLARELAASGDFDTMETLFGETAFVFSELIRTAFIPSEGCRFVVSDFSAIEARVIAWIAGESWTLEAFREGKDIYCETASMMYHKPVVKHGVNGELRAKGKVAVLACGYQGGVGAMKRMDKEGVIPEEELQSVVDQWRDANPHIVKLWRTCELAARMAINEHRTIRIQHGIQFSYINGNLFVQLPCGRKLCYWDTRLKIDSETGREQIVYMGVNQDTKQWGETETYGGKLVENIVQATARDCLAMAMTRVSALGYKIVMHVHDEMIVDVPIEDKDALKKINDIMAQSIDWAPGLPLRGDGYETPFYKKD
jgi:DNA polymerase